MDTQLAITYEKNAYPDEGYTLKTTVVTGSTTTDIYDCLKIKPGHATQDEEIWEICGKVDIFTTPLEILPEAIKQFSAPSLGSVTGGIQEGDVLIITSPLLWQRVFGALPSVEYTVDTVHSSTEVSVTEDFPAFGRGLTFYVKRGGTTVLTTQADGLANRDYSDPPDAYYRCREHGDMWVDYDTANDKFESLRSQAQGLVDECNTDSYTETIEDIYE